jgi:hypothetical protein
VLLDAPIAASYIIKTPPEKERKIGKNPTYTSGTEKFRFLPFVMLRRRLAILRELLRQVMSRKTLT